MRGVRSQSGVGLPKMIEQVARRQYGDPARRKLDGERQAMQHVTDFTECSGVVLGQRIAAGDQASYGRERGRSRHCRTDLTGRFRHPSAGWQTPPRPTVRAEFGWSQVRSPSGRRRAAMPPTPTHAAATCSQLSSTSSACRSLSVLTTGANGRSPSGPVRPIPVATAVGTSVGSATATSGTQYTSPPPAAESRAGPTALRDLDSQVESYLRLRPHRP